jgi:hypothetical protein
MISLADFQATVPSEREELATELDYLVPALVGAWGDLVTCTAADLVERRRADDAQRAQAYHYKQLATHTALLLRGFGIDAVGGDEIMVVTSKLASLTDPWVALSTRVDRIFRAYRLGEEERVRHEAELLWVGLAHHCPAINEGQTFEDVLS